MEKKEIWALSSALWCEVRSSIERGCEFLKKRQNEDGSWGSPRQTKGLNIFMPILCHRAFRLAVTGLHLRLDREQKQGRKLFGDDRKAEDHLLKILQPSQGNPDGTLQRLAHSYGLQALAQCMSERRNRIAERRLKKSWFTKYKCSKSRVGGWRMGLLRFQSPNQTTVRILYFLRECSVWSR